MGDWTLMSWITLGVAVATLAAGIIIPIVVLKRTRPKRELSLDYSATSLFGTRKVGVSLLALTYAGRTMENPHLIRMRLYPTGRDDIGTDDFDAGRPIVVHVGQQIINESVRVVPKDAKAEFVVGEDGRSIEMPPSLFQSGGQGCSVSFMVEGKPVWSVDAPLKNARVILAREAEITIRRRIVRAQNVAVWVAMTAMAGVILLGIITPESMMADDAAVPFMALGLILLVNTVAVRNATRSRLRARLADD